MIDILGLLPSCFSRNVAVGQDYLRGVAPSIYLKCCTNEPKYEAEFDHPLLKAELVQNATSVKIVGLEQKNVQSLIALSKLSSFKNCVNVASSQSDQLKKFMTTDKPETEMIQLWENDKNICKSFLILFMIHLSFSINWTRLE